MVNVAEEKVVHGTVPVAGELVPGHAVPPIGVEAAVREEGELGEDVELVVDFSEDGWLDKKGGNLRCIPRSRTR